MSSIESIIISEFIVTRDYCRFLSSIFIIIQILLNHKDVLSEYPIGPIICTGSDYMARSQYFKFRENLSSGSQDEVRPNFFN